MKASHARTTALAVVLAIAVSATVLAETGEKTASTPAQQKGRDLIAIASSTGELQTLVHLLRVTGLAEDFSAHGPFTIFAPTDEAFAKLSPGTIEDLMGDRARLSKVLEYHVVPGRWYARDMAHRHEAPTLQGQKLTVTNDGNDGTVQVDGALLIMSDIIAANGVIHVIDAVVVPN